MVRRPFDEAYAQHCEIVNRRHKERPCPGCGNRYHLPAQTLCSACTKELTIGHKRVAELAEVHEQEEKALVAVGLTFMRTIPNGCLPWVKDGPDDGDFVRALKELLDEGIPAEFDLDVRRARNMVSEVNFYTDRVAGQYPGYEIRFWMARSKVEHLRTVLDFVSCYFGEIAKMGIRRGRSLLLQLAEAGVDEMNRVTIHDKKERTEHGRG